MRMVEAMPLDAAPRAWHGALPSLRALTHLRVQPVRSLSKSLALWLKFGGFWELFSVSCAQEHRAHGTTASPLCVQNSQRPKCLAGLSTLS